MYYWWSVEYVYSCVCCGVSIVVELEFQIPLPSRYTYYLSVIQVNNWSLQNGYLKIPESLDKDPKSIIGT